MDSYTKYSDLSFLPAEDSLIYTAINQLYNNDWLLFYTRGLWVKWVEILLSCISVFTNAQVCMAD